MATFKIKLRKSDRIYVQIIHNRTTRQLSTPFKAPAGQWESGVGQQALTIRRDALRIVDRLSAIDRQFQLHAIPYTADHIIARYHQYCSQLSLFNFAGLTIRKLKQTGRVRTAETYEAAVRSFSNFRNGSDIILDELTPSIIEDYQTWLAARRVCLNTISFYMRILRAIYNRAREQEPFEDKQPFKKVYTGIEKTRKRALPLPLISEIARLDLTSNPGLDYARDIFMLSFMLRGMSLIDMATLTKSQLHNGRITYRRQKTGQTLSILWTGQMQKILDKYPPNPTQRLLPILTRNFENPRTAYRNKSYQINRALKKLMPMLNISTNMTLYVARHSWATAAMNKGIPVQTISQAMGHDSEQTTRIYLASLNPETIDRANALILSSL